MSPTLFQKVQNKIFICIFEIRIESNVIGTKNVKLANLDNALMGLSEYSCNFSASWNNIKISFSRKIVHLIII